MKVSEKIKRVEELLSRAAAEERLNRGYRAMYWYGAAQEALRAYGLKPGVYPKNIKQNDYDDMWRRFTEGPHCILQKENEGKSPIRA